MGLIYGLKDGEKLRRTQIMENWGSGAETLQTKKGQGLILRIPAEQQIQGVAEARQTVSIPAMIWQQAEWSAGAFCLSLIVDWLQLDIQLSHRCFHSCN